MVVATPLHAAALERLRVFFVVDEAPASAHGRDAVELLADRAGAVIDERLAVDAGLLERLPCLQALSTVGPGHAHLDLAALTRAGIRATNAPLDEAGAAVEVAWRELEQRLRAEAGAVAPTPAAPAKWRPGLRLARPIESLVVRFSGVDAVTLALADRARREGVRVAGDAEDEEAVDVVVSVDGACPAFGAARTRLIRIPVNAARLGRGDTLGEARDRVAAEGLIASLGFGRESFHPPYLLNPEVVCTSCC